jgi:hypothetical protein
MGVDTHDEAEDVSPRWGAENVADAIADAATLAAWWFRSHGSEAFRAELRCLISEYRHAGEGEDLFLEALESEL